MEGGDHLVVAELLRLVGAAVPDRHPCRRRTRPSGSRRRTRGTRAGGPRCARRAGSRRGAPGRRVGAPTRRACRRARAAGPSGGCGRGAPGRRSAASSVFARRAPSARAFAEVALRLVAAEPVGHAPSLPQAACRRAPRAAPAIERKTVDRARVAQLGLGEAAGEHGDGLKPRALGRLAVPGRVADHHRVAAAGLLDGRLHEVRLGLRRLDVRGGRPAVGELAGVEQVEVVVDLLLLGRAGEHDRVAAALQVLDQARARPSSGSTSSISSA